MIADHQSFDRNILFFASGANSPGCLRRESEKLPDRGTRATASREFQPSTNHGTLHSRNEGDRAARDQIERGVPGVRAPFARPLSFRRYSRRQLRQIKAG